MGSEIVLPWLVMFLTANLGGWMADALIKSGIHITTVRKLMQSIGFLGPALFLTLIGGVTSPVQATVYMTCALGLGSFALSGFAVRRRK